MRYEILFSGFGGQGVMLMGKILAQAALIDGKEVVFLPSYGSEMRGGTANCTVTISDQEIESPIAENLTLLVAMNEPSIKRFEPKVKPHTKVLANKNLVRESAISHPERTYQVETVLRAKELGSEKVINMIILGSVLKITDCVKKESVQEALKMVLPERHHHLLTINEKALDSGYEAV